MDIEELADRGSRRWNRLEALLDRLEAAPDAAIGLHAVEELVGLYRQACSDLNRARSLTASPEILGPLNRLVGRAYRFLYARAARGTLRLRARRFFAETVPRAFRRRRRQVLSSAAALILGAVIGLCAVLIRPSSAEALIPAEFFTESPRQRVERIESHSERIDSLDKALTFGASLYTHNIKVGFLAFSLAAVSVAGGYLLLFQNGLILGAVAASYELDGVQRFFFAWVGPHGALEIPAIIFSAAAGLVLGEALIFPGDLSRGAALRAAAPDAWRLLATSATAFVGAGLIEGSFSQFTAQTVPFELKIAVAALLLASLLTWLTLGGRRGEVPPGRNGESEQVGAAASSAGRDMVVLTPEHVPIHLAPAGLGSRFAAVMLDFGVVMAVSAVLSIACRAILPAAVAGAAIITLTFLLAVAYHPFFELLWEGRTPGKRVIGLRVIDARGLPVTLEQALVRNVVRVLDFLPFAYGLAAAFAFWDARGRRLGDVVAGTLVVDERTRLPGGVRLPVARRFNSLRTPRVLRLARHRVSLEDREFLVTLCLRAERLDPQARFELMEAAGETWRRRLDIDDAGLSGEALVRDLAAIVTGAAPPG